MLQTLCIGKADVVKEFEAAASSRFLFNEQQSRSFNWQMSQRCARVTYEITDETTVFLCDWEIRFIQDSEFQVVHLLVCFADLNLYFAILEYNLRAIIYLLSLCSLTTIYKVVPKSRYTWKIPNFSSKNKSKSRVKILQYKTSFFLFFFLIKNVLNSIKLMHYQYNRTLHRY